MSGTGDPTQIREEIDATREDLGNTVGALAEKTDVAGQAKRKLHETRAQATEAAQRTTRGARQKPELALIGVLALGFVLVRRRRRRR